jgi:hypothetical protein
MQVFFLVRVGRRSYTDKGLHCLAVNRLFLSNGPGRDGKRLEAGSGL